MNEQKQQNNDYNYGMLTNYKTMTNNTIYDECYYNNRLKQSKNTLDYLIDSCKYNNLNKCSHQIGLNSGAEIKEEKHTLVDIESDLRGQTYYAKLCPVEKYEYNKSNDEVYVKKTDNVNSTPLDTCQMFDFRKINKSQSKTYK